MTDIVQMSKGGTNFYPKTHVQAVVGLPDFSSFEKASDVQTAITNAISPLQTQVNNSAVGTNLLLGTVNNSSLTGTNISNQTIYKYSLANGYSASSLASALGTKFTVSFDWSVSGSSPSGKFSVQWNDVPWGTNVPATTVSSSNASGHLSGTFSVSADSKNIATMIGFRLDNFVGTLTISNVKLEKGSVATDWCPNPSEIATNDGVQAEIAGQIKANQPDLSGFQKASDVQTAITNALGKVDVSQTMNDSTRKKLQNMNKEMGS